MSMSDQTIYKRIKEIERSSNNIENKYFAMDSNSGTEKVILSSVLDDKLGILTLLNKSILPFFFFFLS